MFNKTVNIKTETNPVTRIVEKTITPDKVTDMYDKVRKEVEASVLRSFTVTDNGFSGAVCLLEDSYHNSTKTVLTRFTLNGKEYSTRKVIKLEEVSINTDTELFNILIEHFRSVILNEVVRVVTPQFTYDFKK